MRDVKEETRGIDGVAAVKQEIDDAQGREPESEPCSTTKKRTGEKETEEVRPSKRAKTEPTTLRFHAFIHSSAKPRDDTFKRMLQFMGIVSDGADDEVTSIRVYCIVPTICFHTITFEAEGSLSEKLTTLLESKHRIQETQELNKMAFGSNRGFFCVFAKAMTRAETYRATFLLLVAQRLGLSPFDSDHDTLALECGKKLQVSEIFRSHPETAHCVFNTLNGVSKKELRKKTGFESVSKTSARGGRMEAPDASASTGIIKTENVE